MGKYEEDRFLYFNRGLLLLLLIFTPLQVKSLDFTTLLEGNGATLDILKTGQSDFILMDMFIPINAKSVNISVSTTSNCNRFQFQTSSSSFPCSSKGNSFKDFFCGHSMTTDTITGVGNIRRSFQNTPGLFEWRVNTNWKFFAKNLNPNSNTCTFNILVSILYCNDNEVSVLDEDGLDIKCVPYNDLTLASGYITDDVMLVKDAYPRIFRMEVPSNSSSLSLVLMSDHVEWAIFGQNFRTPSIDELNSCSNEVDTSGSLYLFTVRCEQPKSGDFFFFIKPSEPILSNATFSVEVSVCGNDKGGIDCDYDVDIIPSNLTFSKSVTGNDSYYASMTFDDVASDIEGILVEISGEFNAFYMRKLGYPSAVVNDPYDQLSSSYLYLVTEQDFLENSLIIYFMVTCNEICTFYINTTFVNEPDVISSLPPKPPNHKKRNIGIGVGVVFGFLFLIILSTVLLLIIKNRKKKNNEPQNESNIKNACRSRIDSTDDINPFEMTPRSSSNIGLLELPPPFSIPIILPHRMEESESEEKMILPSILAISGILPDLQLKYSDFKIGKVIGTGAFGQVIKGELNGTKIAIKQISVVEQGQITPEQLNEFKQEAKMMIQLPPHPNVVLFRGITVFPDPFSIVLEYCKGGSLHSYLRSNVIISNEEKIKFAKDITRGMIHLHHGKKEISVIHRDLAARNILLKEGKRLAVSDFGMARIKYARDDSSRTKQEIGPLKWMAPESIESHIYSTKSDIFSFGVVLYEIVTRDNPWPGFTNIGASHRVLNGERMSIPSSSNCPHVLEKLMNMCWDTNPSLRPDFIDILKILRESDNDEEEEKIEEQEDISVEREMNVIQNSGEEYERI